MLLEIPRECGVMSSPSLPLLPTYLSVGKNIELDNLLTNGSIDSAA